MMGQGKNEFAKSLQTMRKWLIIKQMEGEHKIWTQYKIMGKWSNEQLCLTII